MGLLKLNRTVIYRSIVFQICVVAISVSYWGFNAIIRVKLQNSYNFIVDHSEFPEMAIGIILFGMAVYFSQQATTLENICFVPKYKAVSCKLLSLILCSGILLLNPILYICVMAVVEQTNFLFTILIVLRILIRWVQIIVFSLIVGYTMGLCIRKTYVYLCSIPFVIMCSALNKGVIEMLPFSAAAKTILSEYLSFNKEFISGLPVEYLGAVTTNFHIFKFVGILLIALIIVNLIIMCLKENKRARNLVFLLPLGMALFICVIGYSKNFPKQYDPLQKLSSTLLSDAAFHIENYTGTLVLSETLQGDITIFVEALNPQSDIPLLIRLDEAFDVSVFEINGETTPLVRMGDYISVDCEKLEWAVSANIHLVYKGRVSYINEIDSLNILTTRYACALPPSFAFVPLIDGDNEAHTFSLVVEAKNTLISNLEAVQQDKNTYALQGTAKTIALFEGFLTSYQEDGIQIYHAQYLNKDVFQQEIQLLLNERELWDYRTLESIDITEVEYKKIFNIYNTYYDYNAAVAYDNYIMLNTENAKHR